MSVDPYWGSVILSVPMSGANGSTDFTDLSTTTKTITPNGDAQISTAQSKWGNGSGYFDGVGDYCVIAANADFTITADFTLEMWLYPTTFDDATGANRCFFSFATTSFSGSRPAYFLTDTGQILYYTGSILITSSLTLNLNAWNHFAVTRAGSTVSFWFDGQFAGSTAVAAGTISPGNVLIGRSINTAGDYAGYIQDLRLTKGVARYTEAFTPPTAPFPTIDVLLGAISGTVYEKNASGVYVPGAYPVRIYRRSDGSLVGAATSAEDGSYTISNLPITDGEGAPIEYYVVALDTAATWQSPGLAEQVFPS